MTEHQFVVLADLLGLADPDRSAAHAYLYGDKEGTLVTARIVDGMRQADAAIRRVYVVHGPMEFRITVGHRDTHRAPGTISLKVGDVVRLVAHSTEHWISVRITALPDSPKDYYSGVITEQRVLASQHQIGNGVMFSEDQVMIEVPRAKSAWRGRRWPTSI